MSFREKYQVWERPMRFPLDPAAAGVVVSAPCLSCKHTPLVVKRTNTTADDYSHEHIVLCGCTSGTPATTEGMAIENWQKAEPSIMHYGENK